MRARSSAKIIGGDEKNWSEVWRALREGQEPEPFRRETAMRTKVFEVARRGGQGREGSPVGR